MGEPIPELAVSLQTIWLVWSPAAYGRTASPMGSAIDPEVVARMCTSRW